MKIKVADIPLDEVDVYEEKNTRVNALSSEEAIDLAIQTLYNAATELNWGVGHLLTADRKGADRGAHAFEENFAGPIREIVAKLSDLSDKLDQYAKATKHYDSSEEDEEWELPSDPGRERFNPNR